MPYATEKRGLWGVVYQELCDRAPGSFVGWDELETATGMNRMRFRSALLRAQQELQSVDGLTIGPRVVKGFWLVPVGDEAA